jgi:CheY-like chemotaxis protein
MSTHNFIEETLMTKRILIVEDDDQNWGSRMRNAAERSFKLHVVQAFDLTDAIEAVQKNTFDIVSIDGSFATKAGGAIMRTAGIELIKHLKKVGFQGRIIFFSANDDQIMGFAHDPGITAINKGLGAMAAWEEALQKIIRAAG